MYHIDCVCGSKMATEAKVGVCPACGRNFQIAFEQPSLWVDHLRLNEVEEAAKLLIANELRESWGTTEVGLIELGAALAISKFADPTKVRRWVDGWKIVPNKIEGGLDK